MAKTKPPIKKMAAVRLAVKELGLEAPVAQVRKWVRDKYTLDLTDATASNYVSGARKELREANGKPASVKPSTAAPAPISAPATPKATGNGAAVEQVVEAVTTIKELVGTLGKDNLLKLVEAL
jgi:hypothetical protein